MEKAWTFAGEVLDILTKYGHEAYFVGGGVRDYLLERPVKDIDITTSAIPEEVITVFSHVIPTGLEHGTVTVVYKGYTFEVTTYRTDGTYSDNRRPDEVVFVRNLEEDLARRDFTINAMAMDRQYQLVDLYGGKDDLVQKQMKTVGQAEHRFKEDALRILRGVRFASQLGFDIEESTMVAMHHWKTNLYHVAVERVKIECEKLFQGTYVSKGISLLQTLKMEDVLPVFKAAPTVLDQTPKLNQPFTSFADVIAMYHLLYPDISLQTWVRQWKCSNKERKRAKSIVDYKRYFDQHGLDDWLIYQLEPSYIDGFVHVAQLLSPSQAPTIKVIHQQKSLLPIQSRADIQIDGRAVANIFPERRKGRWIADTIISIEQAIVNQQLSNNDKKIKEWILCHPPARN